MNHLVAWSNLGHLWWWEEFIHPGGTGYWFYSGLAGASFFAVFWMWIVWLRHRNCHVKGCYRLGHPDPDHGWPACRKHHTMKHKLGVNPHELADQ